MKPIEQLEVYLRFTNEPIAVGQMISDNGKVYFKYDDTFIEKGLEISPFKLKLSDDILIPETTIFDGLFGVFNDSLPDGWGKLLLDRTLLSKGISLYIIYVFLIYQLLFMNISFVVKMLWNNFQQNLQ